MFLKTLFIVSGASITNEGSLESSSFAWSYVSTMTIPGTLCEPDILRFPYRSCADTDLEVVIRVRPSSLKKCPRCWTHTRGEEHDLCPRCEDVVPREH